MKNVRWLLASTAAIALWGCGGGGGGSTATNNALSQGRSSLNLLASGSQPANSQSLQTILDLFLLAVQQNPNSSEAHFGAAICLAGVISQQVDGTDTSLGGYGTGGGSVGGGTTGSGTIVPMPPSPPGKSAKISRGVAPGDPGQGGLIPPTPPNISNPVKPLPAPHKLGLIWNLNSGLTNPYMLLNMLAPIADLRAGLMPYYGYSQDDVARRQKMLDGLNTVEQHLEKVEADPNFSVSLPLPNGQGTVTIGLPEVYLFDAYVNSLRAEIALSLAYIRDSGTTWQPTAPPYLAGGGTTSYTPGVSIGVGDIFPSWSPASLDKNKDGKLTPDEYLPPSPYLTLRDAKYLQATQQAMLAIVDKETKGIDGVFARPVDGAFLVPNSAEIHSALLEVKTKVLPTIQQAATGPVTLEFPIYLPMMGTGSGGAIVPLSASKAASAARSRLVFAIGPNQAAGAGAQPIDGGIMPWPEPAIVKVTINLSAWFTNPPPDLKAFAPTLTLGSEGWPLPDKTVYPDPTFGGLFPDGLKNDLPF
jgi:hypothetical protein